MTEFYAILARQMPEFYIIIAGKIFSRILGGTCPLSLPSPTPMCPGGLQGGNCRLHRTLGTMDVTFLRSFI